MSPEPAALVPGLRIGHATNTDARTGCTVLLGPFRAAASVAGMATGTREIQVLAPWELASRADAILLTGGSAFGLAAADGVVHWIEERGGGFETPSARVPIVPAAVLYDLAVGSAAIRPDAAMGRAACDAAGVTHPEEGAVGAGAGAMVGKLRGIAAASRGGFGCATVTADGHVVTAVAAVNAFGDVLAADGSVIAGVRGADGSFAGTVRLLRDGGPPAFGEGEHTTLAAVVTNAPLDRVALHALACMAATALARRIEPVHTPVDGDVVFAASTTPESAPAAAPELLVLGAAAADALATAIERAVTRP